MNSIASGQEYLLTQKRKKTKANIEKYLAPIWKTHELPRVEGPLWKISGISNSLSRVLAGDVGTSLLGNGDIPFWSPPASPWNNIPLFPQTTDWAMHTEICTPDIWADSNTLTEAEISLCVDEFAIVLDEIEWIGQWTRIEDALSYVSVLCLNRVYQDIKNLLRNRSAATWSLSTSLAFDSYKTTPQVSKRPPPVTVQL